jgi:hypothetical protein
VIEGPGDTYRLLRAVGTISGVTQAFPPRLRRPRLITFARSLVGKDIEFYSCFISYSSKDQDFAERLLYRPNTCVFGSRRKTSRSVIASRSASRNPFASMTRL